MSLKKKFRPYFHIGREILRWSSCRASGSVVRDEHHQGARFFPSSRSTVRLLHCKMAAINPGVTQLFPEVPQHTTLMSYWPEFSCMSTLKTILVREW